MRWYALLEGPREDSEHIKRFFPSAVLDESEGHPALGVAGFDGCSDQNEIVDQATNLLASINTALRISVERYHGFTLHGIGERDNGVIIERAIFANAVTYGMSGAGMVAHAGSFGTPARTKEERLASLVAKRPDIADVAKGLATRPMTWGVINITYEGVKGLIGANANRK
jgi:hypothetical protein